jgi:triosephosphate isomerase
MFKTASEIVSFCQIFNHLLNDDQKLTKTNTVIGIAPTYVGMAGFKTHNKTATMVMAQNTSAIVSGAYTSEVSYTQLKDLDVTMILLGHSEVRAHLHEDDQLINKKVLTLLKENMTPVLCIGETLQEFEHGQTKTILAKQLTINLESVDGALADHLIIAYEPI